MNSAGSNRVRMGISNWGWSSCPILKISTVTRPPSLVGPVSGVNNSVIRPAIKLFCGCCNELCPRSNNSESGTHCWWANKNPRAWFTLIAWSCYAVNAGTPIDANRKANTVDVWNLGRCECFWPQFCRELWLRFWLNLSWMKYHQIHVLNINTVHSIPITGFLCGTQPRWHWMNGSLCRTCLTFKPAQTHSLSSFQYPPLSMCFNRSMDANLLAISRLGAWWLLSTEQRRKIAL